MRDPAECKTRLSISWLPGTATHGKISGQLAGWRRSGEGEVGDASGTAAPQPGVMATASAISLGAAVNEHRAVCPDATRALPSRPRGRSAGKWTESESCWLPAPEYLTSATVMRNGAARFRWQGLN